MRYDKTFFFNQNLDKYSNKFCFIVTSRPYTVNILIFKNNKRDRQITYYETSEVMLLTFKIPTNSINSVKLFTSILALSVLARRQKYVKDMQVKSVQLRWETLTEGI